jgi:hypothetical protein
MYSDGPQVAISRVLDAARELAFRAFTDPDHLAMWWGPSGNTLPRDQIEFHDEPHGRTRLEIRQWLPAHLAGPGNQGWLEALEKLGATLLPIQAAATDAVL